ncbi:hypothetical protein [Solobacterium moorei]|uniref:hypothetical protein n=2 Tax=Solobacterium moorei TaxID=102148 RepID=UPI000480092F
MSIILILLSMAAGIGLPMVLIIRNKTVFNVKDCFSGVLFYLIFRVICYPLIANAIDGSSLLIKLLTDFAYLVFITVICKKIYITKVLKADKTNAEKTVSFTIGETLSEVLLANMPNLINLGAYFFMINFGNINESLQG